MRLSQQQQSRIEQNVRQYISAYDLRDPKIALKAAHTFRVAPLSRTIARSADPELEVSGICYDSRNVHQGDLFVAIRGFETDGHRYIGAAVQSGAAVVVCEEKPDCETPYVLTDNSRLALALASSCWFGNPAARDRKSTRLNSSH